MSDGRHRLPNHPDAGGTPYAQAEAMPIRSSRRRPPAFPRDCVRIYKVLGGYLLVSYDTNGEVVGEGRVGPDAWEHALETAEAWQRQHSGAHLKIMG